MNIQTQKESKEGIELPAAEQNIRKWFEAIKEKGSLDNVPSIENFNRFMGPYLTISRQAGIPVQKITQIVGKKLGWDVLDKDLLEILADSYNLPHAVVEFLDEKRENWIHEFFGQWMDKRAISQLTYVRRLGKIMLLAAQHGKVIFVGRGATWILPRENGVAIRLVASENFRINEVQESQGLKRRDAKKEIEKLEKERNDFQHKYLFGNVTDSNQYDLAVNVGKFGVERTADIILQVVQNHVED